MGDSLSTQCQQKVLVSVLLLAMQFMCDSATLETLRMCLFIVCLQTSLARKVFLLIAVLPGLGRVSHPGIKAEGTCTCALLHGGVAKGVSVLCDPLGLSDVYSRGL
jgi:hypothetical protein